MLHLVRRFFGFLTARPLTPGEQLFVSDTLTPDLQRLFYTQRVEDQRHAIVVAGHLQDRPTLIEPALMHDIGKTLIGLGAFGRSFATLWAMTSLPIWGQWSTYINHGPIGAELLEAHAAQPLTVAFARYHPGPAPEWCDKADWSSLERADG